MRTAIRRACALAITMAFAAAFALPAAAFGQSYGMGPIDITAQVQSNGDMRVAESRTFTFDGDFTFVFWKIDKGGTEGIENIEITRIDSNGQQQYYSATDDPGALDTRPPGTYLVTDYGDYIEVRAFHRTSDDDATFVLRYNAIGAAKRWADTGELYWKFIGDQWEVGARDVRIEVLPPAALTKADVKAWAHGPLTGTVRIGADGVVTLAVADLPPETFVEARILYPAEALSQAPVIDQPRLQEVLDEEAQLADEANAERLKARTLVGAVWGGSLLLSLGGLAFAAWAWWRHGKEFKPQFVGDYFREDPRPDLHPAVVGALWRFGTVNDTDIAATLMDLADKGIVRMAPTTVAKGGISGMFGGEEQTFVLERVPENARKATPLDDKLLDILFTTVAGGRSSFALSELKTYAKAHAQTFSETIKEWKGQAEGQADSLGFFDGDSFGWQIGIFFAAAVVAALGLFVSFGVGTVWPAVLCVPSAIGMARFRAVHEAPQRRGQRAVPPVRGGPQLPS